MVLLQTTIFHQKYDFAINLLTPISSKWVETVYLSSLYWKITICIVDWKIYCMVFFNFLVMCSYKNAIYCYKYDIDIWIQSIILTSFYSFSQGAGGSLIQTLLRYTYLEYTIYCLIFVTCMPAYLCTYLPCGPSMMKQPETWKKPVGNPTGFYDGHLLWRALGAFWRDCYIIEGPQNPKALQAGGCLTRSDRF